MCGRYLLRNAPEDAELGPWREYADLMRGEITTPRYNICPSQDCVVLRIVDGKKVCEPIPWGFKPSWSKYNPLINAKSENLFQSKMFKGPTKHHRCLIIADGFYEPKGPSGTKNRPWYLFQYQDKHTFAIAGIVTDSGFAIITTAANSVVSPVHDRMPLILAPEHWDRWLDPNVQEEVELADLLQSREYKGMESYEVGNYVKKPGNEGPQCVEAVASGSLF